MLVNHSPRRDSPRRNYDFPPSDSANFAGIKDPSLLFFANSLRKKDRSRRSTVDGPPPPHLSNTHEQVWNHLLNSAKTHGYTGMAMLPNTNTPLVSPMKRSKKKKSPNNTAASFASYPSKTLSVSPKKTKRGKRRKKKKRAIQFAFQTSPTPQNQPIIIQYHYHVSEPSSIGRSVYALGNDRFDYREKEFREYKEQAARVEAQAQQQYDDYQHTPSRLLSTSALMTPFPPPQSPSSPHRTTTAATATAYQNRNGYNIPDVEELSEGEQQQQREEEERRILDYKREEEQREEEQREEEQHQREQRHRDLVQEQTVKTQRVLLEAQKVLEEEQLAARATIDADVHRVAARSVAREKGSTTESCGSIVQVSNDGSERGVEMVHSSSVRHNEQERIGEEEKRIEEEYEDPLDPVLRHTNVSPPLTPKEDPVSRLPGVRLSSARSVSGVRSDSRRSSRSNKSSKSIKSNTSNKSTKSTKSNKSTKSTKSNTSNKSNTNNTSNTNKKNTTSNITTTSRTTTTSSSTVQQRKSKSSTQQDHRKEDDASLRERFDITSPGHPDYALYGLGFDEMLRNSQASLVRDGYGGALMSPQVSPTNNGSSPKGSRFQSLLDEKNGQWKNVNDMFTGRSAKEVRRNTNTVGSSRRRTYGILPREPEYL
jgi:hypothetical protein